MTLDVQPEREQGQNRRSGPTYTWRTDPFRVGAVGLVAGSVLGFIFGLVMTHA